MKLYTVDISKETETIKTFMIQAENEESAKKKAVSKAKNTNFGEATNIEYYPLTTEVQE